MSRLVLGLDLGEASVGGALLKVNDEDEILEVLWANSRVFSGVVDEKSKITLNAKRRGFRGQRHTIDRRAKRRRNVERALTSIGLLPEDDVERGRVLGRWSPKKGSRFLNPYEIRSRAIAEQVELFELGRALQHILQRRGFRSNRKAKLADLIAPGSPFADDEELRQWVLDTDESIDVEDTAVEETKQPDNSNEDEANSDDPLKTLEAIKSLQKKLEKSGLDTIGAYLAAELKEERRVRRVNRLSRQWLEEEFDKIWDFQSQFYPGVLTPENKRRLQDEFKQRPLKPFRTVLPKRGYIGGISREALRQMRACSLLGVAKPVARRGHWVAHRYRILETLRNLRLAEGDEVRELTAEEYIPLAYELQSTYKLKWSEIRQRIGVGRAGKFTIEGLKGSPDGIQGNLTEIAFKEILGDRWDNALKLKKEVERAQLDLMQDIETHYGDPVRLFRLLQKSKATPHTLYPLTKRQAFEVLCQAFSTSTTNLSILAMRRLHAAMLEGAQPHKAKEEAQAEIQQKASLNELPPPPPIRNPRVHRALTELRKVVNALIKKYGMPDLIRLELATELKETKKDREAASKRNRENKKLNDEATDWYRRQPGRTGSAVGRKDIWKYRLWKQQRETCPYCLGIIGAGELLADTVDIDHVLPIQRSGDDSFSNKVLAHRRCNADKGDALPIEKWPRDSKEFRDRLAVIKRTKNRGLIRKFQQDEVGDDFVARQLQDTRYITKEAVKYLEQLDMAGIPWGEGRLTVWPTNGQATGFLRHVWELNDILPPLLTKKELEAVEEQRKKGDEGAAQQIQRKNRNDHRHHALDAIVVALTNPKRFKAAVGAYRGPREHRPQIKAKLYKPDKALIRSALNRAITSHAVNKGIRGPLHDASYYGRKELNGAVLYVRRISVKELLKPDAKKPKIEQTRKQIEERVYDPDLKRALLQRLSMGDWAEAFSHPPVKLLDGKGSSFLLETVRVNHGLTDLSMLHLPEMPSYVKPNSNHHGEIVRTASGKLELRGVRMVDAANVVRHGGTPYGLSLREGDELLQTVAIGEIIELQGSPRRVSGVTEGANPEVKFRDPNDARTGSEPGLRRAKSQDDLAAITSKMVSDPLGELSPFDGT